MYNHRLCNLAKPYDYGVTHGKSGAKMPRATPPKYVPLRPTVETLTKAKGKHKKDLTGGLVYPCAPGS
jgi:hypothetical protein